VSGGARTVSALIRIATAVAEGGHFQMRSKRATNVIGGRFDNVFSSGFYYFREY
jgi:hypothetical protein